MPFTALFHLLHLEAMHMLTSVSENNE